MLREIKDTVTFISIFKIENPVYSSSFPDGGGDGHDRGNGYDDSKLPVHLNGPEDHGIRLEQIKRIQRL